MSADLHSSGNNSFYSNLIRISEFYNLPDFDPTIFLTETKIKHYVLRLTSYVLRLTVMGIPLCRTINSCRCM